MFRSVFESKVLFRRSLAMAVALAFGGLPAATDVFAAHFGGHGGGFHGGFHGGGLRAHPGFAVRRGSAFRGVHHRPFAHRFFRHGFHGYSLYRYHYYGCYRWRWAATPSGPRVRRVNVCFPYRRHYLY